ncbi:hypothetical protein CKALI_04330 [Corynebacterium kalinowskii]|uniref:Uncharacterized protein n=1 Tax=Corynebacterium kalinowskii TaxID=2675216 RepID=A0A6B8VRV6_9CORY|nr:hypothetical protein [Corynebacterium kalinowskii]QGU01745.1 hypothetical protein CKALI_04330 [Corynebacterium kalinowskii]
MKKPPSWLVPLGLIVLLIAGLVLFNAKVARKSFEESELAQSFQARYEQALPDGAHVRVSQSPKGGDIWAYISVPATTSDEAVTEVITDLDSITNDLITQHDGNADLTRYTNWGYFTLVVSPDHPGLQKRYEKTRFATQNLPEGFSRVALGYSGTSVTYDQELPDAQSCASLLRELRTTLSALPEDKQPLVDDVDFYNCNRARVTFDDHDGPMTESLTRIEAALEDAGTFHPDTSITVDESGDLTITNSSTDPVVERNAFQNWEFGAVRIQGK